MSIPLSTSPTAGHIPFSSNKRAFETVCCLGLLLTLLIEIHKAICVEVDAH